MKKTLIIILSLFILSTFGIAHADFEIPKATSYVNDYSSILNSSEKTALNNFLRGYDQKTSNQIFIGIFKSLEGGSLEDISIQIAEKWKPGRKDKDNGVLLLVFTEDRKIRIEVGYGLEGVLTDALASAIINNEISPNFKNGEYFKGIKLATSRIAQICANEYSAEELKTYASRGGRRKGPLNIIFTILIILLCIRNPFLGLFLLSGGLGSGGRYSGGGLGGGGFSGGFGGGFGGGGASGGW